MDEKITIINSILYTLDQIPVQGHENHERMSGIYQGLQSLRRMLLQAEDQDKAEEKKPPVKKGDAVNG